MHGTGLKSLDSADPLPGCGMSHHGRTPEVRLPPSNKPKAGGDPHDQPAKEHDLTAPLSPPRPLLTLLLLLTLGRWTLLPSQAQQAIKDGAHGLPPRDR